MTNEQPIYIEKHRSWWPWAIVVLLVIVVFGQWKCYHDKEVKYQAATAKLLAQADTMKVQYYDAVKKNVLDSIQYTGTIKDLRSLLTDQQYKSDSSYNVLQNQVARMNYTIAKIRTAHSGKDTAGIIGGCDTLVNEFYTVLNEANSYKNERDSIDVLKSQMWAADSVEIKRLNALNVQKDAYIAVLQANLMDMARNNKDLQDALAKTKKGRKWLLIAGILVGAVGEVLIHK